MKFAINSQKFVCVGLLLTATAVAQAGGIAFVTNIKGAVKVDTAKLVMMAELNKGQRIACVADCTVGVMYLQSGKEFVIKGPGEYLVGDGDLTAKIGLPPTIRATAWRISSQAIESAQTSSASVRMRSLDSSAPPEKRTADPLNYPASTKVTTLQPVFRWTPGVVKGPYDFQIDMVGADATKPVYKASAAAAVLKLPAAVKLMANTRYTWKVSAGSKEMGSASFQTLPAASMELVQKRKPEDKAEFSDRLLYALMLQELEVEYDSQELFKKLAKERPELPELAALIK